MNMAFSKDQADGLRRMLGKGACHRVLVIAQAEQIDDVIDNLRVALTTMGRDAAVVSAQTVLAVTGMLEEYDAVADVTLVAADFGTRALDTAIQACDDVMLVVPAAPDGIKTAYALLKKTAALQSGAGIHAVVSRARSVDAAMRVFGNLSSTVGQYLNTRIDFAGYVPDDRHIELAVSLGKPVASAFPTSPSAMAFRQLVEQMLSWASAANRPDFGVASPGATVPLAGASASAVRVLAPRVAEVVD